MAGKHTKAVFIDNQPFTLRSYQRSVTDDIVSRFISGEQGDTNLDLLKALTQKSFRGGMFQRVFEDPEKVSSISNGYYNKADDKLYMTPDFPQTSITDDMNAQGVISYCFFKDFIYYTYIAANPPNTGKAFLIKMNPATGAKTSITLPVPIQSCQIRLHAYDKFIYLATASYKVSTDHCYQYDGNTSFIDADGAIQQIFDFAGNLYGMQATSDLFAITNPFNAPMTFAKIGTLGFIPPDGLSYYQSFSECNGAMYIGMQHGLYRYDGVSAKLVIDMRRSADPDNFKYMATWNGRLYYNIGNVLYQFDGTTVEPMQDFGAGYTITDLQAGHDRLWIGITIDTSVQYSDKFNPGGTTYTQSVFCYNGVGFFEYKTFSNTLIVPQAALSIIPIKKYVHTITPDVYYNGSLDIRSNGYIYSVCDLRKEFTAVNLGNPRTLTVVSSEIDANYPAVSKVLNGIMPTFTGGFSSQLFLKIEVQYFIDNAWSSFIEIFNTQNMGAGGAINDYPLHEQVKKASPNLITSPGVFNKFRYKLTVQVNTTPLATAAPPAIQSVTSRYTLQPRMRRQWLLSLQIDGLDKTDLRTPRLSDGAREVRSASELRRIIYDAYRFKKPVLFYDVDFSEVKTVSPLAIKGTDFIQAGDVIAVQDGTNDAWINRRVGSHTFDDVNQKTDLTLDTYGYRAGIGGSSNTALAVDSQVRRSHAIYVKSVRNERVIVDDPTINAKGGFSDIASELVVELVEV